MICPYENCGYKPKTKHGLNLHIARKHRQEHAEKILADLVPTPSGGLELVQERDARWRDLVWNILNDTEIPVSKRVILAGNIVEILNDIH